MDRSFRTTLIALWIALAVAIIAAIVLDRRVWVMDSLVMGSVMTGVYMARERLFLTPLLFGLLSLLVAAHCLAVFGMFRMSFFGAEYDSYFHASSAVVLALVALNFVRRFGLRLPEVIALTLLIALGFGLLNELVEFAGYLILGRGEGLFLLGPGDIGATNAFENLMTDFLNDFYGNVAGLLIGLWVWRRDIFSSD